MKTNRKDRSPETPIRKRLAPTVQNDAPASSSQIVALDLAVAPEGKRLNTLVVPPIYVAPSAPGNRPITFDDIVINAEQVNEVEFRTSDGLSFHLSDQPIGNGSFSFVHLVKKSDSIIDQIYALKEIAVSEFEDEVEDHRLYNVDERYQMRPKLTMTEEDIRNEVDTAHALRTPLAPHFAIRVRKDEFGRDNDRIFLASPVVDQNALNVIRAIHQKKTEIESANTTSADDTRKRSDVNYALGVHLFFDGIHELEKYHRKSALLDIKPENILLDLSPIGKLTFSDFGLAQDIRGNVLDAGTVGYMAPEAMFALPEFSYLARALAYTPPQKISGAKADLFSFGRTLIEAITGELPYSFDINPRDPREVAELKEWLDYSDKLAQWGLEPFLKQSRHNLSAMPKSNLPQINSFIDKLRSETGKFFRSLIVMNATSPEYRAPAKSYLKVATRLLEQLTARDASGRFIQQGEREYRETLRSLASQADRALLFDGSLGDIRLRARAAQRLRNKEKPETWPVLEAFVQQDTPAPKTLLEGLLRKHDRNYNSLSSMRRSGWLLPLDSIPEDEASSNEAAKSGSSQLSAEARFFIEEVFTEEFRRSPSVPPRHK